jgi:hypothetical protein
MDVRYYLDPDTDQLHIYGHGIAEAEVEHVLSGPGQDLPADRASVRLFPILWSCFPGAQPDRADAPGDRFHRLAAC